MEHLEDERYKAQYSSSFSLTDTNAAVRSHFGDLQLLSSALCLCHSSSLARCIRSLLSSHLDDILLLRRRRRRFRFAQTEERSDHDSAVPSSPLLLPLFLSTSFSCRRLYALSERASERAAV